MRIVRNKEEDLYDVWDDDNRHLGVLHREDGYELGRRYVWWFDVDEDLPEDLFRKRGYSFASFKLAKENIPVIREREAAGGQIQCLKC